MNASGTYSADSLPRQSKGGIRKSPNRLVVSIALETGLNLRASATLAETASDFKCTILVRKSETTVDGKGILSLMSLGADTGSLLEITAKGPGAHIALDKLAGLTTHEGLGFFSVVDRDGPSDRPSRNLQGH